MLIKTAHPSMAHPRLIIAVFSLLAGCSPLAISGTVTIPHPERAELRASATQVALNDPGAEGGLGLSPNTLTDRAAIRSITDESVCFQLTMWATRSDPLRSDFSRYAIVMVAEDEDGTRVERTVARRSNEQSWVEQRNGRQRIRWATYARVTPHAIAHRTTDVCFDNRSALDASTRRLRLVLRGSNPERQFAWRLSEEASYQANATDGSELHPPANDPPPPPPQRPQYAVPGVYAVQLPRGQYVAGQYAQPYPGGYGTGRGGGLTAVPVPGVPQVAGGRPVDTAQLEEIIRQRFGLLRQCLSREAERDPRLNRMRGRILAEFTVGPSGVRNVRVISNDFTPGAASCMVSHLRALPIQPDPMRWTSMFQYSVGHE